MDRSKFFVFPSLSYLNFCFVTSSGIFNTGHDTFWYTIFCFQVRLAQLLPKETGTITSKLRWYNWSHLALAQLFPSDTDTVVPKWHWRHCWHRDYELQICILFCGLLFGTIITSEFHLRRIVPCTRIMIHDLIAAILRVTSLRIHFW